MELCDRYDFAYYREWGVVLSGWCMGGDAGAARIEQGLAALRAEGALARQPYYLSLLAEVRLDAGDRSGGRGPGRPPWRSPSRTSDRWWVPELLRLKAAPPVPGDEAR